jgi:eukaryotic-like serine/threonine-protein kinase
MLVAGGTRMTGRRLGPWVIDAEIGRGAMGIVYRAHNADDPGIVVALKVLNADLARDDVFVARFQREIEALRQLDHPNIVHFLEAGSDVGLFFYAMEYVAGRDCEAILRERGRLPWPEVLDLALQVVPALKHAHDRGIIHRDLKPANIMLTTGDDQSAVVKLTDFGVAKLFARPPLTAAGSFVGTAAYLAPEQAVGKPATKRSDFYSLGGVLYTLLTGRPPFPGENVAELIHKHCYAIPDRPQMLVPDLPHDLDGLVMQLLEKDPARRPTDGFVLLRQLERIKAKLDRKQANETIIPGPFVTMKPELDPSRRAGLPTISGEGPATLASRLMRKELIELNKGGPIQRFFNHPLMLVLMLAACVGLIAWGLTRKKLTAEELYAAAEPLMRSDRPADWRQAWNEYLEPLTERFPDDPHKDEIAAFQRKMQDVDRQDKALKQAAADAPRSEAERFYRLGLTHLQNGDVASARRVWQNLVRSFADVPAEKRWVELAERGLGRLDEPAVGDRFASARTALAEARKLRDDGKREAAERIWHGLEALYRDDPTATPLMSELRKDRGN